MVVDSGRAKASSSCTVMGITAVTSSPFHQALIGYIFFLNCNLKAMSTRRRNKSPAFSCQPREYLCPAVQATTDTILKSLKKSKRQCRANLNALSDELEILERLYYKGKNQHSSSLVWKRITEARRYAQRVRESAPLVLLDSIHLAFFELDGPAQ